MNVVDEIVSGPLSVPLEATNEIDEDKKKLMKTKKGRAVKGKAKDDDFARVQKFVNEGKMTEDKKLQVSFVSPPLPFCRVLSPKYTC